ncbi:MAG: response regulator [Phycisphaerae bacterium]
MADILLVDDDVDLVLVYQIALSQRGHTIRTACSAAEAQDLLADQPDLLVTDLMMETKTAGLDLARKAHEMYPEMQILMVSGILEQTGEPMRFADDEPVLPVVTFVDKPIAPAKLADTVEAMLTPQ